MSSRDAETALREVVRGWDAAMVRNDPDDIGRYMASDWLIIGSDGGQSGREAFLSQVRDGTLSHDEMTSTDVVIRVYGDAAVVTARGISGGTFRGRPFREHERQSNMFVRQGGEWRCVLTHLSRLVEGAR